MDWVTIIIVVISVGVWALANLSSMNKKPPQVGQGGNAVARNRPSASEIDRFLEEVNRRKQQQQERRVSAPPPVQKREVKKPPQVEVKKTKVVQRQVITTEPIVQNIQPPPPSVQTSLVAPTLASLSPISVPAFVQTPTETPHVKQAKSLLKSQDGLKTIFVVNEILGPPRSRKPRGGRFG